MKTPITLKIKFKSSSLDQFIERYSVDVSRGGIFIRTKEPLPVGTTLRFEFQLQDGASLIGGEGTVVWNRAHDPNRTGVAPGMGVRFDKLTADSQRVLERILSEKHKRGEAQLESRFDAGVRASREARSNEFLDSGTPLPAPAPGLAQPMGLGHGGHAGHGGGGFGDEPTRMMAADQMNQLAEQTKNDESFANDQPTRRASLAEIQRAVSAPDPIQKSGSSPSHLAGTPVRTGRTGEQVRLGSGAASPALPRGMSMPTARSGSSAPTPSPVQPAAPVQSASPPAQSAPQPAAPVAEQPEAQSHRTRPLAPEHAATLIAASSEHTPSGTRPLPMVSGPHPVQPSTPRPPELAAEPPAHLLQTLQGATVPEMRAHPVEAETQTLISPPPPETAGFLAAIEAAAAAADAKAAEPLVPEFTGDDTVQGVAPSAIPPLAHFPPHEPVHPSARESGTEVGNGVEAPASGISISIPVDVDLMPAAEPLDPRDFAPSGPTPTAPEKAPAPIPAPPSVDLAETARRRPSTSPSAPQGSRTTWYVVPLVLAVLLAAIAVYALYVTNKLPGTEPVAEQPKPVTVPTQPPVVTPAPGIEPAAKKPDTGAEPNKAPDNKGVPGTKDKTSEATQETGPKTATQKPGEAVKQAADGPVVSITSEPSGAQVELAGKTVGTTPAEITGLAVGKSYEVNLTREGYQATKAKFHVSAGENKPQTVKLQPYERVVDVASTPKGAEVFLDGKKVSGRTPLVIKKLDMKKVHQVEVRKTGYTSQVRNISETDAFAVKSGKEVLSLSLTLEQAATAPAPKKEERPKDKPKKTVKEPEKKTDGDDADKPEQKTEKPEPKADPKSEGKGDSKGDGKADPDAKAAPKPDSPGDTVK